MKVAWFDAEEWEKEYISKKDRDDLEIDFFENSLNSETVVEAERYDAVTVFVDSNLDKEVLDRLDVELVACRSTGFDHVDLDAASENGIKVCNVPDYGKNTVAEHTFGLILSISRKIHSAIQKVEEGSFDHKGLRGFDLKGKTIGVIGTGSIGKHVIRIANGFQMEVIAHDPYPDREAAEKLGFEYIDLDALLEKSDIVSIHCPLNDSTRYLISEEEFEKMDDTVLINTARGEIVKTEALIEALEKGNVKAAGLDVLEEECYIEDDIEILGELKDECDPRKLLEDHILMKRDDVIVTPHNGFNSVEAVHRIADTTLENLRNEENTVN